MPAKEISLENAKSDKLFYFVANVVPFSDGKCLVLKRSKTEKVHPDKYCVPGGKLEWNDMDVTNPTRINGNVLDYENAVEDLLRRETLEEAGIEIDTSTLSYINSVSFIRPDGIPVVLLKFCAKATTTSVSLEKGAFTDYKWVDADSVDELSCIDGIADEVKETIKRFS